MQRVKREAVDEFLSFVGELGDPAARTKAGLVLNRIIEMIWLKHPWRDFQSPTPLELTLSVNQRHYALPDYVGRLGDGTVRSLTRGVPLHPRTTKQLTDEHPEAGTTYEVAGFPRLYVLGGITGVADQPIGTGEAVEVVSDDPADTDVVVTVEGDDATYLWDRTQVTLTGTTPVAVGTWTYLDGVGKSDTATSPLAASDLTSRGTITVRCVTSQRVLQRLRPEEAAKEHRLLTLYPKPSEAEVLALPVMRRPKRLRHDGDPLPADWWPAIFRGMVLAWREQGGEIAAAPDSWPELVTLIAHDNRLGPRQQTKGWAG